MFKFLNCLAILPNQWLTNSRRGICSKPKSWSNYSIVCKDLHSPRLLAVTLVDWFCRFTKNLGRKKQVWIQTPRSKVARYCIENIVQSTRASRFRAPFALRLRCIKQGIPSRTPTTDRAWMITQVSQGKLNEQKKEGHPSTGNGALLLPWAKMATVISTVYVHHGSNWDTSVYFFFVKTCQTQAVHSFRFQCNQGHPET